MTIKTTLLVRYRGGYTTVGSSARSTLGRREGFLSIDVGDLAQAQQVAQQVLDGLAVEQFDGAVEVLPDPADATTWPLAGFAPGRRITVPNATLTGTSTLPIVGVSFAVDDNGYVTWVPEIAKFADEQELRLQRTIKRMVLGTIEGASQANTTTPRVSTAQKHRQEPDPIVFSFGGALVVGSSSRWYAKQDSIVRQITVSLDTLSGSSTTVVVYKNGSTWQTISVAAAKVDVPITEKINAGDYLKVGVTATGTGTPADLTVQIELYAESDPPTITQ